MEDSHKAALLKCSVMYKLELLAFKGALANTVLPRTTADGLMYSDGFTGETIPPD